VRVIPVWNSIEIPDQGHVPLLEGAELIGRIIAFVETCERVLLEARQFAEGRSAAKLLTRDGARRIAQNDLRDVQGGENPWRTEQEKKNDRAIDRSDQSTMKKLPHAEKKKSDPWVDVQQASPAAAKNKQ
jgi:hypothetical protein